MTDFCASVQQKTEAVEIGCYVILLSLLIVTINTYKLLQNAFFLTIYY